MKPTTATLFDVLQAPEAKDLHPSDKLLMLYLKWRQGQNHAAWPGVDRIAADLGMDERLCRRAIARLCAAGCVIKTPGRPGRGRANRYTVVEEKGANSPPSKSIKGGKEPPIPSKKGGYISHKRGAGNPLKEQGRSQEEYTAPTYDWDAFVFIGIPDSLRRQWLEAYPLVDVEAAIRKAAAWVRSNQRTARRTKDWSRFLNNWLARDQRDAEASGQNGRAAPPDDPTLEELDATLARMGLQP